MENIDGLREAHWRFFLAYCLELEQGGPKRLLFSCGVQLEKFTLKCGKPRQAIGKPEGSPPVFIPNKFFKSLLRKERSERDERGKLITAAAVKKYGAGILVLKDNSDAMPSASADNNAAEAVFAGPSIDSEA